MRIKGIKPSELPECGNSILYCRKCRGEFSATRGDYWDCPDKPMKCCGVNLALARRVTYVEEVAR